MDASLAKFKISAETNRNFYYSTIWCQNERILGLSDSIDSGKYRDSMLLSTSG